MFTLVIKHRNLDNNAIVNNKIIYIIKSKMSEVFVKVKPYGNNVNCRYYGSG